MRSKRSINVSNNCVNKNRTMNKSDTLCQGIQFERHDILYAFHTLNSHKPPTSQSISYNTVFNSKRHQYLWKYVYIIYYIYLIAYLIPQPTALNYIRATCKYISNIASMCTWCSPVACSTTNSSTANNFFIKYVALRCVCLQKYFNFDDALHSMRVWCLSSVHKSCLSAFFASRYIIYVSQTTIKWNDMRYELE